MLETLNRETPRVDSLLVRGLQCFTLHPGLLTTSSLLAMVTSLPLQAAPGRAKHPRLPHPPQEPPRHRRGRFGAEEESLQPSIDPSKEEVGRDRQEATWYVEGMQGRREGDTV